MPRVTSRASDGAPHNGPMSRLSVIGVGLGVGIACAAGCTIETGYEPPPPPPWGTPLVGGTILVTRDGSRAVVADPDRDRVVIVDLASERITDTIVLAPGSAPGRVIDDGAGRIHVALRGSGELLTISGADRVVQPVCAEPRGLAWQEATDLVHVACATGELISMPAAGGEPTRVLHLERDLRDVVVRGDELLVTTFRGAQVLELDAQGTLVARISPPVTQRADVDGNVPAIPEVAWRTIALPDGTVLMSHQRRLGTTLRIVTGGYGGHCNGTAVESTLTSIGVDNRPFAVAPIASAALPVDIAVDPRSGDVAMVSAGTQSVQLISHSITTNPDDGMCGGGTGSAQLSSPEDGMPTSVAYTPNGTLLVYYPEADSIAIYEGSGARSISLGDKPRKDAGRTLFHQETSSGLACASCHPEGRDDGGVWTFDQLGPRRTQSLAGGIVARAPYHWGADMPSFHTLVDNVFTQRMGGEVVEPEQERALLAWLDRVPAPPGVVVDADAVVRGKELFDDSEQGCASCHGGALMSNMGMANVTGIRVKVPSLVGVGARAPYMHDGCAATLRDRFGACGGGDNHGHTSQLTEAQLSDLIAYLDSL